MTGNRTVKFTVAWDDAQVQRGSQRTGAAMGKLDAKTKASQAVYHDFTRTLTSRMGPAGAVAESALDGIAAKAFASGNALKLGVAGGAAVAAVAVGKFAISSAQKTSALNEQINATKVTFKGASADVLAFGRTTASSLGISNRAALESASAFGAMLNSAGVARDRAADMSTSLVKLAADIASIRDIDPGDALSKLRSLMAGETEPGRTIGIFLNETVVKAKAAQLGLGALNRELTEGEKVQARFALIMDQTGDAQGDFGRTSGSLANQQRILSAQFEDFQAKIGQLVTPALIAVTNEANTFLKTLTGVSEWVGKVVSGSGKATIAFGDEAGRIHDVTEKYKDLNDAQREELQLRINNIRAAVRGGISPEAVDQLAQAIRAEAAAAKDAAAGVGALAAAQAAAKLSAADLRTLLTETTGVHVAARESAHSLERAQRNLRDAQAAYSEVLKESATDIREVEDAQVALKQSSFGVADAQLRLKQATFGVADAQQRVIDAQKELDDLYKKASAGDVVDARLDVRSAELAQKRATDRLLKAQGDLNFAEASGKASGETLAEAQLEVEEAKLAAEQATRALTRAQEAQNAVASQGVPTADQLRQAQNNLRDANLALEAAANGVRDAHFGVEQAARAQQRAQLDLAEAQRGDITLSERQAKAKDAVRDAEWGVEQAKRNHAAASAALVEATHRETTALAANMTAAYLLRLELEKLVRLYPALAPGLGPIIDKLPPTAPKGDWGPRTPFAKGGVVKATPGGVPATLAEAGKDEAVVTLDGGGSIPVALSGASRPGATGGASVVNYNTTTTTVQMPPGSDGEDVVAALKRYERRNGKGWRN